MNQRTHAWIAIRAIALLEDEKSDKKLVALLKPHVSAAAIGAWIPDLADAKRGGGATQHHVLKNLPYDGSDKKRFVANKDELLGRLVGGLAIKEYLTADTTLSKKWWSRSYKADPAPGQHVANRAMALGTTMRDLLIIGDPEVDKQVPGSVAFLKKLAPESRTSPDQAALYFFMLSHFVADACMPCHCDGRKLAGYAEGLHDKLEAHWGKLVGTEFAESSLSPEDSTEASDNLLDLARQRDEAMGLSWDQEIPNFPKGRDVWSEVVDQTRASFALASIIAPESQYPYDDEAIRAPFDEVFGDGSDDLLAAVDRVVLYDAVMNTAMVWRHIWTKVSKSD